MNPSSSEYEPEIKAGGRVLLLGVGGEGGRVASAVASLPGNEWIDTAILDTDQQALNSAIAKTKLAAVSDWLIQNGAGCGGNIIRGERAISRERARIATLLENVSLLIVTAGLGGGTATGGMRTVASVARAARIPTVFLLNTPFSFEAYARKKNTDDCIADLLPVTDILVTMPNDLLFSNLPANTPAGQAFELATAEMARTVSGVAAMLQSTSLFSTGTADLAALLRRQKCACGIGVGTASSADGLDRGAIALERMLASPFLGGLSRLEACDSALVVLSGGNDLQIAEMKRLLEQVSGMLPKGLNLVTGAAYGICPPGSIQLTVISIKYEQTWDPIPVRKDQTSWKSTRPAPEPSLFRPEEVELDLRSYSKGIFATMPPTRYKDEDLDIPTFQRRGVTIDKGTTGR